MNTLAAYARGLAAQGEPQRVFDWEKAARIIRERRPHEAEAGLSGDWEYTGGSIYRDGQPVEAGDTYVYLSSNWATPSLRLYSTSEGEFSEIECWRFASDTPGWGSGTLWPDSALAILRGDEASGSSK